MRVMERQLVLLWWSSNWYERGGEANGMGVVEEQLVWLW